MKVLVAGGSGMIGRPLVRRLVAAGHDVHAMTRSAAKREGIEELGARVVVADALAPGRSGPPWRAPAPRRSSTS